MADDFNSPILISHLFEAVKFISASKLGKESISTKDYEDLKQFLNAIVFDVLGLQTIEESTMINLIRRYKF